MSIDTHGLTWAQKFHETYERLAPQFGYETRKDTRQFESESRNGQLMIAVCGEMIREAESAERDSIAKFFEQATPRANWSPEEIAYAIRHRWDVLIIPPYAGQVSFQQAVRDDPAMTPEQKAKWLGAPDASSSLVGSAETSPKPARQSSGP